MIPRLLLTSTAQRHAALARGSPSQSAPLPRRASAVAARRAPAPPLKATMGDDDVGGEIPLSEAYKILGVKEGAPYDDVLRAKERLASTVAAGSEKAMEIELAYDAIFNSQLKARLSGAMAVSSKVRFADVAQTPRRKPESKKKSQPVPTALGVAVRPPPAAALPPVAGVFGTLAAWTLAQGLMAPSPQAAAADVPGFQLALGLAAGVYFLRETKKVGLGKAVGLAVLGLVAGTALGSAAEGWLRVDLIPLGALGSPGAVVGEFALAGLFAAVYFLA